MVVRTAAVSLAFAALAALPARAQDPAPAAPAPAPANTVRPGMTEAEVRAQWGEPLAVRNANEWTYMFYASGMESVYRYNDVVFLQNGQVVDAIVRAPGRSYAGNSSSPADRTASPTLPAGARPAAAPATPGAVTGVRFTP